MTKPKTKLVCVGWGIWLPRSRTLWWNFAGIRCYDTEKEAIDSYNQAECEHNYEEANQASLAITKKLWIEVNHD